MLTDITARSPTTIGNTRTQGLRPSLIRNFEYILRDIDILGKCSHKRKTELSFEISNALKRCVRRYVFLIVRFRLEDYGESSL